MPHTILGLKTNQRDVTPNIRNGELLFLHMTRRFNVKHVIINVHQSIPYTYLVMWEYKKGLRKILKECNSKNK